MNHALSTIRTQGVRIPENQSTEQSPAMTVTRVARLETLLVEWGNERGQTETAIGVLVGGKFYVPPNYQAFTAAYRPLVDVLSQQVAQRLEEKDATAPGVQAVVPMHDSVDVTGGLTEKKK